jgi:hypothetical protein
LLKPSPSISFAPSRIETVLDAEGNALELPAPFVATTVKEPDVPAAIETLSVADVPPGLIEAELTVRAGGLKVGRKAKVAPWRLAPVTWTLVTTGAEALDVMTVGLIPAITGEATTVKG